MSGRFLTAMLRRASVSKIGISPPDAVPGRSGLGIAVIVRNEARHIAEWASFHHHAGVSRFIVYDDACTDGTIEILRTTLPDDALTVVPWAQRLSDSRLSREIHNQTLAYAHAASNFGGALRWMAFIDVDEFLVPTGAGTLTQALAPLEAMDVRNISLPWHMFGTSGHEVPPEGGVLSNYLQRARDPMSDKPGLRAFKCIVDPCHLTAVRVHSMETDDTPETCNDRGEKARHSERDKRQFYSTEAMQLNHYYTRSRAELDAKIGRGPNLRGKAAAYQRKVLRTVDSIESDTVEDTLARDYFERTIRPRVSSTS